MIDWIEQGDIYLFYRRKIDSGKPGSADDLQRFYMILAPDEPRAFRLFLVGKKKLPAIEKSRAHPTEREWALNIYTGDDPVNIRDALAPTVYQTKAEGGRRQPGAVPAAQGRYRIVRWDDNTVLACRVGEPRQMGEAQQALNIRPEASYVVAVKNPEVETEGFPDEKPDYPERLRTLFANKRWIDVDDPELLDYQDAQIVLIGASDSLEGAEVEGEADLFGRLGAEEDEWPLETLREGRFTSESGDREPTPPVSDPSKGGRRGGRAALQAPSAAGIAKALEGIDLPGDREDLVRQAKENEAGERIVETLESMPNRTFRTMADVEKALGEVR